MFRLMPYFSAMNWIDQLPPELSSAADRLAATAKPCVRLHIGDQAPAQRWHSCLGRVLYWPADQAWPVDRNGRPLFGLLQLNLADLPALPDLPTFGILQFFITDDPFWGATPLQPFQEDNFRVLYHPDPTPETTPLLADFSFLPIFEDLPLQRDLCLAVTGHADTMPLPPEDFRFAKLLGDIFTDLGDAQWDALNLYRKAIGTVGHRLGGYPGFAGADHRSSYDLPWELLLQLDTDPKIGLFWGDYGVAHWFNLSPTAERRLNAPGADPFAEIWYGWESA